MWAFIRFSMMELRAFRRSIHPPTGVDLLEHASKRMYVFTFYLYALEYVLLRDAYQGLRTLQQVLDGAAGVGMDAIHAELVHRSLSDAAGRKTSRDFDDRLAQSIMPLSEPPFLDAPYNFCLPKIVFETKCKCTGHDTDVEEVCVMRN